MRNIRVPDELWNAAQERAAREDVTLSQLIRRFLRAYAEGARTFKW
jgi:predicted HicB family RNase H-like nuclease